MIFRGILFHVVIEHPVNDGVFYNGPGLQQLLLKRIHNDTDGFPSVHDAVTNIGEDPASLRDGTKSSGESCSANTHEPSLGDNEIVIPYEILSAETPSTVEEPVEAFHGGSHLGEEILCTVKRLSETVGEADWIGCGVEGQEEAVFFTVNGKRVGK